MPEREIKNDGRYTVEAYYKGFRILLTQPFTSGEAIVGLLNKMTEVGFTSQPNGELPAPTPETKETGKENEAPICEIHNTPMVSRKGQYGMFWACPVKTNGEWCKFKPKKK